MSSAGWRLPVWPPGAISVDLLLSAESIVALSCHARGWIFLFLHAPAECNTLFYTDWLNKTYFMGTSARNNHVSFRHSAEYRKILNLRPVSFLFCCATVENFCNILCFSLSTCMPCLGPQISNDCVKNSRFEHFFVGLYLSSHVTFFFLLLL